MQKKKSWRKGWLIFLAVAIAFAAPNYVQYQLSPLGLQVMEQFSISATQFNSVFTAPMIPALFTCLISGLLVDRFGFKAVVGLSVFLCFVGSWVRVAAGGYGMLFFSMILAGFSLGFLSSNVSKILGQLFGTQRVGVMVGLVLTVSTCSLVLAMSTTVAMGVQTAFVVAGVLCTVALVLWFGVLPNVRESAEELASTPRLGESLKVVLHNRHVWVAGIAAFFIYAAMTGMGSMIPTALQARGVSAGMASAAGTFLMAGNLLGSLITPGLSMRIGKYRLPLMICGGISVVGCCFGWLAAPGPLLCGAMLLCGFAFGSGMAQVLSVSVRLPGIGPVYAGTAGGMIATLELLGGVLLPTYIASRVAGDNYGLYFTIIGVSSLVWIGAIYLMPKSLDEKG